MAGDPDWDMLAPNDMPPSQLQKEIHVHSLAIDESTPLLEPPGHPAAGIFFITWIREIQHHTRRYNQLLVRMLDHSTAACLLAPFVQFFFLYMHCDSLRLPFANTVHFGEVAEHLHILISELPASRRHELPDRDCIARLCSHYRRICPRSTPSDRRQSCEFGIQELHRHMIENNDFHVHDLTAHDHCSAMTPWLTTLARCCATCRSIRDSLQNTMFSLDFTSGLRLGHPRNDYRELWLPLPGNERYANVYYSYLLRCARKAIAVSHTYFPPNDAETNTEHTEATE
jgi:hypothetical protein